MRRDPFAPKAAAAEPAALEADPFTDREAATEAFARRIGAADPAEVQVLAYYGVGGIGKTTLGQKLCGDCQRMTPPLPYARFNLENIGDQTQAYREAILRLRSDFEASYKLPFPNFDIGLAVITAREGGEPPPLMSLSPGLKTAFSVALEFTPDFVKATTKVLGFGVQKAMERSPAVEQWVRHVGGTRHVIDLAERLIEDDQIVLDEMVRRFAQDLSQNLPERPGGQAVRGVIFLDTYEALWTGRESGRSAQARLLDGWVRLLAEYCLGAGVQLVLTGREAPNWATTDPDWEELVDTHMLGGLTARDAQLYLHRRGVGPSPDEAPPTRLQQAITRCANTADDVPAPASHHDHGHNHGHGHAHAAGESHAPLLAGVSCHLLFLALCAEIVLNHRAAHGGDPPPSSFDRLPSAQVAATLATRFMKSLHNRNLELWVEALSLTPRFDERAALALDHEQQYHNGRAGWESLTGYSFVEPQPGGMYRMNRTMREALRARIDAALEQEHQEWFRRHWEARGDERLEFYHCWRQDTADALRQWRAEHESAVDALDMPRARALLTHWADVSLDGDDRDAPRTDADWAATHAALGRAVWRTPIAPRAPTLARAAAHYRAALSVHTAESDPLARADAQIGLALALMHYKGDRGGVEQREAARRVALSEARRCLEAALAVYTPEAHPEEWANAQNHLGIIWSTRPYADEAEYGANQRRSIEYFEASLRVWTEAAHPKIWARAQHNIGVSYLQLPDGDKRENVSCAVEYFESALRGRTRADHPTGWALTQWNIGAALLELPEARADETRHAVAHFEASLHVYTEADFPEMWAEAQRGLGNAWRALADSHDEDERRAPAHLRRAANGYEAALHVWTEADCPADHADTQLRLTETLTRLAERERLG